MTCEQVAYPTRRGLPVSPLELDLPPSHESRQNNHHSLWTRKRMGRLILTQTLRDLEAYQDGLPLDSHNWLHQHYSPPEIDLEAARERLWQALSAGERLRTGSLREPSYEPLSWELLVRADNEYKALSNGAA